MWRIRVDTGGTFTDCWALPPDADRPLFLKVLSSGRVRLPRDARSGEPVLPADWGLPRSFLDGWNVERVGETAVDCFTGEEAPVLAIRILTGTRLGDCFPAIDLRLATTRGTNALLEGKGAPVACFVTRGFGDLLRIRDQRRPDLFALEHRIPPPLARETVEVRERLDARGAILEPIRLDDALAARCRLLLDQGIRQAAVALLHSYVNPDHERALGRFLRDLGFASVSLSSELAPLIKLLPRAETAVVNACLAPVLEDFLDRVGVIRPVRFHVMTSAGGLEPRERFLPKDSLFSGPAGGVVGAAAIARALGRKRLITFDMGGTSTDVARWDGDFLYQFQQRVGPASLFSPSLRIETVASGGGSICRWTDGGLRVGPDSAGADPGPACYGRGGPLTLTDVNLLLGRIDPARFAFPIGPAEVAAARRRLDELGAQAGEPDGERLLTGLVEIAVEQMADSIRAISVREGADPSDHALLAFGGAGPLHACDLAEKLGIRTLLIPAEAGVLSAFGLHHAVEERFAERQILRPLADCTELDEWLEELRATAAWRDNQAPRRRLADLRIRGQEATLPLDLPPGGPTNLVRIADRFRAAHESVFGYRPAPDAVIELVTLRVVVDEPADPASHPAPPADGSPELFTVYLKPGWTTRQDPSGALLCERPESPGDAPAEVPAAVRAELFRHRFEAIAREMGALLERTATSTNIRERLDFSCALLDAEGHLVVNAPHIPVHLGALGLCVREVAQMLPLGPGDVAITNHPAFGGSHLPDVTLIAPVFAGEERLGYVANRAHHAEIGGIRPGSMPPGATRLAEEGVVISPRHLFRAGSDCFGDIAGLLSSGPWPTRNLAHNLADLHAQAAAIRKGIASLEALAAAHTPETVRIELAALASRTREAFRNAWNQQPLAAETARETLDDGTVIQVTARRQEERLILDFAGTSGIHPGNLNATPAIVRSAVLYCLRLWTGTDLPLNEGLLHDVTIHLPEGCFLNPVFPSNAEACPAVVGGNVETSQRIVDTVLKLVGLQAASQGTMNNLIFGNERFGYYETIAGGAGGGPGRAGASAVHTHMTNTAITDPEILEHRYPVRLLRFAIRRGSGGAGIHPGGDGVIRELEFLAPLEVSLLTQRRTSGPYGWAGGSPGKPGHQELWRRAENRTETLPGIVAVAVQPGDRLRIETPGGGGYGAA